LGAGFMAPYSRRRWPGRANRSLCWSGKNG